MAAAAGASSTLKPTFRQQFMKGFGRAPMALAFGLAGTFIGDYLADLTGSEELGSSISAAAMAAGVGLMFFGPAGAITLALASLAVAGLSSLAKWCRGRDQDVRERVYRDFGQYNDMSDAELKALDASIAEEAAAAARLAEQEAQRALNMMLGAEERRRAIEKMQETNRVLANLPTPEDEFANDERMKVLMERAIGGDSEAAREILANFAKGGPITSSDIAELTRYQVMDYKGGLSTSGANSELNQFFEKYGRNGEFEAALRQALEDEFLNQLVNATAEEANAGTVLGLPVMPNREDFSRWWKTEGREDRDFNRAMRLYRNQVDDLREFVPNIDELLLQQRLGNTSPTVIQQNSNEQNNYQIHMGQDGPGPYDYLFGGSNHPYSAIGGMGR